MLIDKFLITILTFATVASSFAGRREVLIEPARSEILPFNSDSLYVEGRAGASLLIDPIEVWERDGDSYSATYKFPFEWLNRTVLLRIDYVAAPYWLEINGEIIGECEDGNTPLEFNLTRFTNEGLNTIAIHLDRESELSAIESWQREEASPIRGAMIIAPAKMTLRDIEIRTLNQGGQDRRGTTISSWRSKSRGKTLNSRLSVAIKSYNLNDRHSTMYYSLRDPNGEVVSRGVENMTLSMRGEDTLYISTIVPDSLAWSAESPRHYLLDLKIKHEGWFVEYHRYNLGLRSVEVDSRGDISINGRAVSINAITAEREMSAKEMISAKERGANTLLIGAGVPSAEMLNIADSIGLYVILTAPIDSHSAGEAITIGGNPTNDPAWRERYKERVMRSYHSAKRHPAVIAFAIAQNSRNGINLYEAYLQLKEIEQDLPIIYRDGGGEWNSDKLNFEIKDGD